MTSPAQQRFEPIIRSARDLRKSQEYRHRRDGVVRHYGQVFVAQPVHDTQQILLDQIREAVVILDAHQPTLPLLALNRAYRDLFPPDAAPPVGAALDSVLSLPASATIAPQLQAVITEGTARKVANVPFTMTSTQQRTAQITYWDWQCQPTHGVDGVVEQIVVTMTEVTAQRGDPGKALLNGQAGTVATLIGELIEGVFILDRHGAILEANHVGLQLLKILDDPQAHRFGDRLRAAVVQRNEGQPFDPFGDFITPLFAGQTTTVEHLVIGDGAAGGAECRISLTGAPIFHASAQISGAVIIMRDESAQQQTDQEKDAFLSLISHEIKSPLTSIKGFAQLAVRAIEADEEPLRRAAKHLRVIEQQADRIGRLISDLSDVSRMQRGKLQLEPTVFDLVPIIHIAVEQQQPNLGTHRIFLKLPAEPLIVRADPQRIQQLLGNLLSNAAKASPLADRIEVTVERHGEAARLAVRDSGTGIPPQEQSRIFERFYRTTGGGGSGLGLGLFIAQQIAQHSSGTLTVESMTGSGSTFRLDLPLAQPDGSSDDDY